MIAIAVEESFCYSQIHIYNFAVDVILVFAFSSRLLAVYILRLFLVSVFYSVEVQSSSSIQ